MRVLADAMMVRFSSSAVYWKMRSVAVQWITSFQVTLGAMIDSVVPAGSQTRRNTGIAPKVLPSLGSVE